MAAFEAALEMGIQVEDYFYDENKFDAEMRSLLRAKAYQKKRQQALEEIEYGVVFDIGCEEFDRGW